MRLPQIQITTTNAKMDLNIEKPQQIIQQPQADLQIEQPAAILEINTTKGVLRIDSSQARRDVGMISIGESIMNFSQEGKQENLNGIARSVREGRQMMMSAGKNQGPVIGQIAKQNHGPHRVPIGLDFIPSVGSVKIDYTPGTTDVNIQKRNPKIDVQVNKPIYEYTPGKVTGTLVQRADIEIDVME